MGELTPSEKNACIYFAVSHWGSGVDMEFLRAMNLEEGVINSLISKNIVEAKATWELFQKMADGLKERADTVRKKMDEDMLAGLDDPDADVLGKHSMYQSVADSRSEKLRYHLSDEGFHLFVGTKADEEPVTQSE